MNEGRRGRAGRGGGETSYDNGHVVDRTLALRDCHHFFLQELWITEPVVSHALVSLRVILLINSSRHVTTERIADNRNLALTA